MVIESRSMNIAQALKEKNRISGRIARLENMVNKYNQYNKDDAPEFDAQELMTLLCKERKDLLAIKQAIAKANAGIADKLVELAEAKSTLTWWERRFSSHGPSTSETLERMYDPETTQWIMVKKERVSVFSTKDIQERVDDWQKVVEALQDEIDNYNATTSV